MLTIALRAPGAIRWGVDGWVDARDQETRPNALGLHLLDIDTPRLRAGRTLDFTFRSGGNWVGQDFEVLVTPRAAPGG